jgi:hypothetical protein
MLLQPTSATFRLSLGAVGESHILEGSIENTPAPMADAEVVLINFRRLSFILFIY